MQLFRSAFDYYGSLGAQQLLGNAAVLTIVLVFCFAALHLLRRASGYPLSTDAGPKLAPGARIRKYEVGARVFHWGNLLFVAGLAAEAAMYVGHRDNVTEVITIWRRRIWSIRRPIHVAV
jgi:hypothetical protein